jgi:hypothetical protein
MRAMRNRDVACSRRFVSPSDATLEGGRVGVGANCAGSDTDGTATCTAYLCPITIPSLPLVGGRWAIRKVIAR